MTKLTGFRWLDLRSPARALSRCNAPFSSRLSSDECGSQNGRVPLSLLCSAGLKRVKRILPATFSSIAPSPNLQKHLGLYAVYLLCFRSFFWRLEDNCNILMPPCKDSILKTLILACHCYDDLEENPSFNNCIHIYGFRYPIILIIVHPVALANLANLIQGKSWRSKHWSNKRLINV